MTTVVFDFALLPTGLARKVAVEFGADGIIRAVRIGERSPTTVAGAAIPGMVSTHSHAFQRAMAGGGENRAARSPDSFWTWRERMYALVNKISPRDLRSIAAQLFIELLKGGYTGVVEFQYLHTAPGGRAYADMTIMSRSLISAARDTGIALTLVPVLYQQGGFRRQPLRGAQRRFGLTLDRYIELLERLQRQTASDPAISMGLGVHSLRAVHPGVLKLLLAHRATNLSAWPMHIHAAEQPAEVVACRSALGAAPLRWLLDNADVDEHWCVVHGTQAAATELAALARSGGRLAVCPSTEGNLGDGIPDLERFLAASGAFTIGTDSNVCRSAVEELRWLEYGQRLRTGKRLVFANDDRPHTAERLWQGAASAAGTVADARAGAIEVGKRADLCVIDIDHPAVAGGDTGGLLNRLVFAADREAIRDVMVAGRWLIRDRTHAAEQAVALRFRKSLRQLDRK